MAFAKLEELLEATKQRVSRVTGGIDSPSDAILTDAVEQAVLEYSRLVPRVNSQTYDGTGSAFSFTLTSGLDPAWVNEFSRISFVIYPADSTNISQDPDVIDPNDYMLYPDMQAPTHLRFKSIIPASGTDNVLMRYTTPHVVDSSTYTPTSAHDLALEYLGAAHACEIYGTQYEHSIDPVIEADSVDRHATATEWREWARYFRGEAYRQLGASLTGPEGGTGSAGPAGGRVDFDPKTIFGQQVWRTHRGR